MLSVLARQQGTCRQHRLSAGVPASLDQFAFGTSHRRASLLSPRSGNPLHQIIDKK